MTLEEFIARDEGTLLFPYRDSKGYWTIGIGRNLDGKGMSIIEQRHFFMRTGLSSYEMVKCLKQRGITLQEAKDLLDNDIKEIKSVLLTLDWFNNLNDARQWIIINMSMMGVHKVLAFEKMIEAIKIDNWGMASHEMLDSAWSMDVKGRSIRLAKIMRTGILE